MKYTILVVDDESEIRVLLRLYLEKEGFQVVEAENGEQALEKLNQNQVSMILLDIMMPEMDGFETLQRIRSKSNVPVVIISAKVTDGDKIYGLNLGADDYITKPFNPLEAVARIKSNLRRFYDLGTDLKHTSNSVIEVEDLKLHLDSCQLFRGDQEIQLTSTEYRLMKMFMKQPGQVFTKKQIFEEGWGASYFEGDNCVMVGISKLRSKLGKEGKVHIATIRGLGYRLEAVSEK